MSILSVFHLAYSIYRLNWPFANISNYCWFSIYEYENNVDFRRGSSVCGINSVTVEALKDDLRSVHWNDVLSCNNAEEAYNIFIDKFQLLCESRFVTSHKLGGTNIKKPWITKVLLKSIKKKDRLYRLLCRIEQIRFMNVDSRPMVITLKIWN